MKLYNNYDLYKHNTMRLHCIAQTVMVPETEEELSVIVKQMKSTGRRYLILGAGSNVVLPPKLLVLVILLSNVCNDISFEGNEIICGCSVRIQSFIRECQKQEVGGIEYLFSVPCSMGGATVMNAGRGSKHHQSISDYVLWVECMDTVSGTTEKVSFDDCGFGYRHSNFQHNNKIILRTALKLEPLSKDVIEKRIKDRLQYAHEHLDDNIPSCGSVFNEYNKHIMSWLQGLHIGGARYSKKKTNWISNYNSAKHWHVIALIRIATIIHKLMFRPYHLELQIVSKHGQHTSV